jgi:type I restriction enzyme S subunit
MMPPGVPASPREGALAVTETLRGVLEGLRQGLARLYGDHLKGLYVFGSYARGEATSDSDLDVLIVLDRVDDYGEEIKRTSRLISSLSLECGISLSRVFVSQSQWAEGQTAFLQNVREEAAPV